MTRASHDPAVLSEVMGRVERATGSDRELDGMIFSATTGIQVLYPNPFTDVEGQRAYIEDRPDHSTNAWARVPPLTASIDAALALVEKVLPGWWWSIGYCTLTNDAVVAPAGSKALGIGHTLTAILGADFRASPAMQKLLDDHPELDGGIDVARVGGNVPLAIIEALLKALQVLHSLHGGENG